MSVDALVQVSFNSKSNANNGARMSLTGTTVVGGTEAPFEKIGTAAFSARNQKDSDIAKAITSLAQVVATHSADLDFLSITVMRRT